MPLEALLEDPNLAALEAGEDGDMLESMDALTLDDEPDEAPSAGSTGKGNRKAKVRFCPCTLVFCPCTITLCSAAPFM